MAGMMDEEFTFEEEEEEEECFRFEINQMSLDLIHQGLRMLFIMIIVSVIINNDMK